VDVRAFVEGNSFSFQIGDLLDWRILVDQDPFGSRGRKLISDVNEVGSSGQSEDWRNFSNVASRRQARLSEMRPVHRRAKFPIPN